MAPEEQRCKLNLYIKPSEEYYDYQKTAKSAYEINQPNANYCGSGGKHESLSIELASFAPAAQIDENERLMLQYMHSVCQE